ncbi:MAG: hypothetical protein MZV70_10880 [Desulfobacterales bacterium]|nr:hypothetical protein [Desulfobacterales bacterium]
MPLRAAGPRPPGAAAPDRRQHPRHRAQCRAFMAAQAGTPVTMPLVLEAARQELRKLDRPVHEADFRWNAPMGVAA